MSWRATILTLFPEMFPGPLGASLAGKALASGLWELEARDIRSSASDKHRSENKSVTWQHGGFPTNAELEEPPVGAGRATDGRQ